MTTFGLMFFNCATNPDLQPGMAGALSVYIYPIFSRGMSCFSKKFLIKFMTSVAAAVVWRLSQNKNFSFS